MKKMKKHLFVIILMVFVFSILGIFAFIEKQDNDCSVQPEEMPPHLYIRQVLYYTKLPEATEISLEEYPCDLTPIINAIKRLDSTFDESFYRLTVHNYAADENEISGEMKFIYYVDNKIGAKKYYANIKDNTLDMVYYIDHEK
ncbi:MAG: hypothetical protein ACOX7J_09495 [Bacillota bacterium]|jgi:hypothetical protein